MRCENCEEAELVEVESEEGASGYICENATDADRESGSGCGAVIAADEVKRRKKDAGYSKRAKGKVKVEEERDEDDDDDDDHRTPAKGGGKENVAAAANCYLTPAPRRALGKALHRAKAVPASAPPSSNSLSFSASALRSKLRQQAATRLSGCSFDIDDHIDLASLNTDSMLSGQLTVQRAPLMLGLSVKGEENCLVGHVPPLVHPGRG